MQKYEYQTKVINAKGLMGGKVDIEEFDNALNEMGSQGWRLVESTASNISFGETRYIICTFMREKN